MHLLTSLVVLGERCRLQKKKSGTSAFRMRESLTQTDMRSAKSIPLPFEELSSALSTQDELQHRGTISATSPWISTRHLSAPIRSTAGPVRVKALGPKPHHASGHHHQGTHSSMPTLRAVARPLAEQISSISAASLL